MYSLKKKVYYNDSVYVQIPNKLAFVTTLSDVKQYFENQLYFFRILLLHSFTFRYVLVWGFQIRNFTFPWVLSPENLQSRNVQTGFSKITGRVSNQPSHCNIIEIVRNVIRSTIEEISDIMRTYFLIVTY